MTYCNVILLSTNSFFSCSAPKRQVLLLLTVSLFIMWYTVYILRIYSIKIKQIFCLCIYALKSQIFPFIFFYLKMKLCLTILKFLAYSYMNIYRKCFKLHRFETLQLNSKQEQSSLLFFVKYFCISFRKI